MSFSSTTATMMFLVTNYMKQDNTSTDTAERRTTLWPDAYKVNMFLGRIGVGNVTLGAWQGVAELTLRGPGVHVTVEYLEVSEK